MAAGVADSKNYGSGKRAHERRVALAAMIHETAAWSKATTCPEAQVDAYVAQGGLNRLEQQVASALVRAGPACHRIVADGKNVFRPLEAAFPQLEAHNKGESVHVAVAAASICAKVVRDTWFHEMAARYAPEFGPITGGGYTNKPTRIFVQAYVDKHGDLPPEARRSWPWDTITGRRQSGRQTPGGSAISPSQQTSQTGDARSW